MVRVVAQLVIDPIYSWGEGAEGGGLQEGEGEVISNGSVIVRASLWDSSFEDRF